MRNLTVVATRAFSLLAFTSCNGSTSAPTAPKPRPTGTHPQGTLSTRITGLGGRPFGISVTSTGDILVTEQDLNRIVHLDAKGSLISNLAVGADPRDVVANRAATLAVVSGFNDGTLSFVDLATNTVTTTMHVSSSNAYRLAFSADESLLYVTSTDGHIYAVDPRMHTVVTTKQYNGSLQGLVLNHAGNALYVSSSTGEINRLDPSSLAATGSAHLGCDAQDIAISYDDSELYVACERGSFVTLNASTLSTKSENSVPGEAPFSLVITPDNAQLYVATPAADHVRILDVATGNTVKTLIVTGDPRRIAFSASGDKAYVANEGNWIDVIQ